MGLALDNNVIIFSLNVFSIIIYIVLLVMAGFNLAPVQTPKFAGKWFYILMAYTAILTIIYGYILWN